jgi:hypothetical protein
LRLEVEGLRQNNKMPYLFPFEKLDVYQKAVDLVDKVLNFLEAFPQNKYIRRPSYVFYLPPTSSVAILKPSTILTRYL